MTQRVHKTSLGIHLIHPAKASQYSLWLPAYAVETEEVEPTLLMPWPMVLMNSGYWMTRTSDLDGTGALVTGLRLDRSKLGLLRPKPGRPRLDRLGNRLGG